MNWSNLKVKTKLAVLVAMMCSVLAVVAGLGFYGISDTAGGIGETNQNLNQVAVADSLVKDFLTIRLDLVYMMLLTDSGRVEEKRADMVKQIGAVREGIKKIEATHLQDKEKELLKQFSEGFEAYLTRGKNWRSWPSNPPPTVARTMRRSLTLPPHRWRRSMQNRPR